MSKITFLTIACGLVATAAGFVAWRQEPAPRERATLGAAVVSLATPAVTASLVTVDPWPAAVAVPATEVIPDSDTTGLLMESPSLDELLEAASAGSSESLSEADRERLAALIRSDPELRKHIRD